MINLIPPEGEKAVRREYQLRTGATGAFLIGFVFLILSGSLLPTYILTGVHIQEYQEKVDAEKDVAQVFQDAEKEVKSSEELLTQLKSGSTSRSVSELIRAIEGKTPQGITYKALQMNTAKRTADTFLVQGIASTREDLVRFKNTLKEVPLFDKVEIPIADLARDTALPFAITITLKPMTR